MSRIYKFLFLSWQNKLLLLQSFFALGAIRIGLWLLPFRVLRRLMARFTPQGTSLAAANPSSICSVTWAIKTISHCIPDATCLTQAMVAYLFLSRRGQPASLRIGVAKTQEGKLQAHAWVESQGRIVIGKLADLKRYTVLPPL